MINGAEITDAIVTLLQNNAALAALGIRPSSIERAEYPNRDDDRVPWVGVYRLGVVYEPRSLGGHAASWNGSVEVLILVQVSHLNSAADCEDRIEAVIAAVLDAIWADPDIRQTVSMVSGMSVRYLYDRDTTSSLYWQQAELTLNLEVQTG